MAMRKFESGAIYTEARPKPATTDPAIIPVLAGGNHLIAGGVADAYPNPSPSPVRTPNPRIQKNKALDWEITIKPAPVSLAKDDRRHSLESKVKLKEYEHEHAKYRDHKAGTKGSLKDVSTGANAPEIRKRDKPVEDVEVDGDAE